MAGRHHGLPLSFISRHRIAAGVALVLLLFTGASLWAAGHDRDRAAR